MRLRLILTAAIVSPVASRGLNLGAGTVNDSQMGPLGYNLPERPFSSHHEKPQRHNGRRIRFKRDGLVTGFFDDDYASDANWKKFTEKGGALVSPPKRAEHCARLTSK